MSNAKSRLPGPSADVWDWQRNGACRGRDSAQFFHRMRARSISAAPGDRREGRRRVCPVRAECAAHARRPGALRRWGGFTEAERVRLARLRGWKTLRSVDRGRGRGRSGRRGPPGMARLGLGPRGRDRPPSAGLPAQRTPVYPNEILFHSDPAEIRPRIRPSPKRAAKLFTFDPERHKSRSEDHLQAVCPRSLRKGGRGGRCERRGAMIVA